MARPGRPLDAAVALTRSKARSFYLASLFLPQSIRRDVYVIYAYYRIIDDLVDDPPESLTADAIADQLNRWEDELTGRRRSEWPLLREVLRVAAQHEVPVDYLTMVLQGGRIDLGLNWMRTTQELIDYSVLVAGSVGMVMSHMLGATSEEALIAACDLGVAMQLTNVLRDVAEDWRRGRVYLPSSVMERAGCTPAHLALQVVTPEFRCVAQDLISEARKRYESGMRGISYLDRSVQLSIYVAATLYARILEKIESEQCDVFARRIHLGPIEKWTVTMPMLVQHRLGAWRQ